MQLYEVNILVQLPSKGLWSLLLPSFLNTLSKIIHIHQPSRTVHNHSNSERFWWKCNTFSNDWEHLFLSDPIIWVDGNRFSFQNVVFFSEYWTTVKVQTTRISAITAADATPWNFSIWPFKLYTVGKLFNLNDHCRRVFSFPDKIKNIQCDSAVLSIHHMSTHQLQLWPFRFFTSSHSTQTHFLYFYKMSKLAASVAIPSSHKPATCIKPADTR